MMMGLKASLAMVINMTGPAANGKVLHQVISSSTENERCLEL